MKTANYGSRPAGLGVVVCWLSAAACGGPSQSGSAPAPGPATPAAPQWVHKGSGAQTGSEGKAFFGVGIADGIFNEALARQTADNRARGEIAKIFDTYIASMMKDYQRSTTSGDFSRSSEEQDVVSAQKTVTEVTLRGVEIRDHWQNPRSGALYALAVLDLEGMLRDLDGQQGLPAALREHVRANARRAFDDLDSELARRRGEPVAEPPRTTSPAPPGYAEPEPLPAVAAEPEPRPEPQPRDSPPAAAPRTRLRIGLKIAGTRASIIQTCFAERLTAAENAFALYEGSSDVDIMVQGKLRYEKAGFIRGSHMVRAWIEVRLTDMADGKTLLALEDEVKEGRPTLERAVQNAITTLCQKVAPRMVEEMRRRLLR